MASDPQGVIDPQFEVFQTDYQRIRPWALGALALVVIAGVALGVQARGAVAVAPVLSTEPCNFGSVCALGHRCVRVSLPEGWAAGRTACMYEGLPSLIVFDVPFAPDVTVTCGQKNRNYFGTHSNYACIHAVDLASTPGPTDLRAAADGVVWRMRTDCPGAGLEENIDRCGGGFGNFIQIRHADGTVSMYAHLQRLDVTVGQRVARGEVIGLEGATGFAGGRHVHFSVHRPENGHPGPSLPFRLRALDANGQHRVLWSYELPCGIDEPRVQ